MLNTPRAPLAVLIVVLAAHDYPERLPAPRLSRQRGEGDLPRVQASDGAHGGVGQVRGCAGRGPGGTRGDRCQLTARVLR